MVLAVVGAVIPIALAVRYGSIHSPGADDWSYDLSTFNLARHGVVNLNHWGTVNSVGQMALAAPLVWVFGAHIAVLNLWTAVTGVGGLLSTDYLLRRAGAGRWVALASAAALGVGPMYASLATTFMTDVPSYSLMMAALAVAASDPSRERMLTRRSGLALVLGAVAFTVREPAGVAFVAVALGRWHTSDRRARDRWPAWAATVGLVGLAALVFYVWRREIPTTGWEAAPHVDLTQLSKWYSQEWLLPLLGLMLVVPVGLMRPVAAVRLAWARHRGPTLALWLTLVAGPWLLRAVQLRGKHGLPALVRAATPPLGNWYFSNTGDAERLAPIVPWWGLFLLAVLSSLVWVAVSSLLVLAWRRWRDTEPGADGVSPARHAAFLAAVSAAGYGFLLALIIVTQEQMWDRYLLPLAASLAAVLAFASRTPELAPATRRHRWNEMAPRVLVVMVTAGIACSNLAYTTAMDGWDGSEWAYSQAFAQTVPNVDRRLIYTNWLWNSVQAGIDEEPVYHLDPSYRPCWVEVATNSPIDWTPADVAHPYFERIYRNWVVSFSYGMVAYDGAAARPECHIAPGP